MVSPSKSSKYSRVADPNKVKLVRGTKPLFYFKFYLDIENHSIAEKIESKIKELGGSIEFFLNKDITHFVTDKSLPHIKKHVLPSETSSTIHGFTTPKPSSTSVQFPNDLPSSSPKLNSPNDFKASSGKPISRADILLQKARHQHQTANELQATKAKPNQISPIQVAEDSNIIVWTTNYAIRYLEKINNSLQYLTESSVAAGSNNGNRYRSKNVKHLKGDFVKIESFQRNYRPFYKEFKKWPTLNLSARLTNSPFDTKSDCDKKQKQSSIFFSKLDSRTTVATATNNTVANNTVNSESNSGNFNRMTRTAHNAKTIKCIKETAAKDNSNVNTHLDDNCYEQNIKQCGYCEICRVEYDVLKIHLKTDEHLNFIKNDINFLSLDKLISSGANLEKFLKLNSAPLPKISGNSNGMKKVANKSITRDSEMRELLETQEKLLNGYAELNDLKLSRNLRSTFVTSEKVKSTKAEKTKTKNVIVDNEDTEGVSQCKSIRLRRQSTTMRRINYVEPKDTVVEYDSDEETEVNTAKPKVDKSKIKLYGVRWRPPRGSSQEKSASVLKSTPLVYKVIDDKPKAKTSTVTKKNYMEPSTTNEKTSDLMSGSLIVKFKRLRQSELNLLNNEAENFMFPQKKDNETDDYHTETDTDDDRHTTSERTAAQSFTIPSSDQDPKTGTKKDRNDTMERLLLADVTSSCCRTRRRRNQLEAFLNDNNDYYKFEETGSRLRFQEEKTATVSVTGQLNNQIDTGKVVDETNDVGFEENQVAANKKKKWHLIEDLNSESVTQQTFSFERIPSSEPWYDAFHRQDHGVQRVYSYFGNTAYRKLPFEIGPLPPLQPNCCKNPPQDSTLMPSSEVSATKTAPKPCNPVPKEQNTFKNQISSNDNQMNRRIAASIAGLKRKQMLIDLDKPRKSPREHASTLAILSSLIHQRKKRDSVGVEIGNGETSSSSNNCLTRLSEPLLNHDDTTNSSNSNMSSCHTEITGKSLGRVTRAAPRPKLGKSKKLTRKKSANDESSVYSLSSGTILNQEDNIYTSAMCKLKRQVDNLLSNAFLEDDIDNMSIDIKIDELEDDNLRTNDGQLHKSNLMEIDLNDMKKDFVELLSSDLSSEPFTIGAMAKKEIQIRRRVQYDIRMSRPMGPFPPDLRYSMCAKKRANRTGWPNVVKRKIVTRKVKKSVDEEAAAISLDDETVALFDGDPVFKDEDDDESILTADVEEDLKSQTKSDGRISTDIFVVSSDTQSITENVTNKTDIDNLSTKSVYEDAVCELTDFVPDIADVVKNRRKTQQNPKYFSSQYTNSLSPSKKQSPNEKNASIKYCSSTRSGPSSSDKRKTVSPKKTSLSPSSPNVTPTATTTTNQNNNNNQAVSPSSAKYSPRKLRKPRGRWYRER